MRDPEQHLLEEADAERQDEHRQEDRLRDGENEVDHRVERLGEMHPLAEQEAGRDGERRGDDEGNPHLAGGEPEVGDEARVVQEAPEQGADLDSGGSRSGSTSRSRPMSSHPPNRTTAKIR